MHAVTAEDLKRKAAERAVTEVRAGMVLGLGTGSTVAHFLDLVGARIASGALQGVVGIPTSVWTEERARALGIGIVGFDRYERVDLAVDGADEVGPGLDLVKGMGGALLREKMVAQAADRFLVIADGRKVVPRLGTVSALPVEVVPWGHEAPARHLRSLGAEVSLRHAEDGAPLRTDNGNLVLDCRFPDGIEDPDGLERAIRRQAGVVETGLFLGMAHEAIIAREDGIERLDRNA